MMISRCLCPLFCLLLLTLFLSCKSQDEQKSYNVLFIAIDDLRTELNSYGAEHIISPNIDQLADNGIRFTKAHVQQAICMASRASILSGIRPERHGIYTGEAVSDVLPNVLTMNQFFAQNGYEVVSTGKIYHYDKDTKAQFGEGYIAPKTTWEGKGYVTKEGIESLKLSTNEGNGFAYEAAEVHDTIYKDGINTLNAMRALEKLTDGDDPFFLAVGLTKPHLPFNAPKKYWDIYPRGSIALSELTDSPINSGLHTMRNQGELGNYYGIPQKFADIPDSLAITLRHGYYACVTYIDAQVGNLLKKLDDLGLRESTIVVLWGDHGYKLGDYNSWSKWSNMNIDTNIPLIIKVPNGPKGEVYPHPVEALDLYPTLAELCNLEQPKHLEGRSLVSVLNNPGQEPESKQYAYTIWPHHRWNYDKTIMGYSVTDDRFNYVEWVQLNTGEVLERELYDHEKDPMETVNVVSSREYSDVIAELAEKVNFRKESTEHDHRFKNLR